MSVGTPGHGHPHKVGEDHQALSPAGLPAGVGAAERKALGETLRDAAKREEEGDGKLARDLCTTPAPTVQQHAHQAITEDQIEKLLGMDVAGIPSAEVGRILRIRIDHHEQIPGDAPGHHNLMCGCD
jgi:hypothetical protein